MPHVSREVEVVVVDPDRVALKGRRFESLAVVGQEVEARSDMIAKGLDADSGVVAARTGREDRDRTDR